jgi:hypothetical protein
MGQNTHSRRFKDDDIGGVDSALDAKGGQRQDSARSADQGRPVRMVNGPGRERLGLLTVWLTPGFMPPGRRPFGEQAGLLKVWLTSRLDKFQEG